MNNSSRNSILLVVILTLVTFTLVLAQERIIKPGDLINIVVYGHEELSRPVTVSSNGSIDYPFMQNIPVDGMSLEELRRFMVAQLSRYLDGQPVVTLSFSESQLIAVSVLGYVKKPGTVQMPLVGTLQEAVSLVGGPLEGAKMDQVTLIRDENGEVKKKSYNLVFLNLLGDMRQNPVLRQGDIVLVTGNPIFAGVKVIGAVNDPGIHESFYGATVMDMIFKAGGLDRKADVAKIRYVSPSEKKSREVQLDLNKYYSDPYHYSLPVVMAGDIIIVPEKTDWFRSFIGITGDLASIMTILYYVTIIRK
jgi:polysaccharide biosynthesis/export protein